MNKYLNPKIYQPRQSCIASFKTFYGIGKIKAAKLNTFLLNHSLQTRFAKNFISTIKPIHGNQFFILVPIENTIRLSIENYMQKKILIFCYQAYRLFQELPTRGQRTKANAKSHSNYNPYKSLQINISFYHTMEIAYKKKELINNERYDELNAYTNAHLQKEKMKGEDQKEKNKKAKQEFIKRQRHVKQ